MHCAVNAIDEGVPAIFLSYSAKSIGMCRYVYGDDRWALSLKDAESKLPDLMCEMMDAASEEHSRIVSRYDEMYQYYLDHLGDALGGLF
jgi:polysaccharide pyruvyl transferase WcaK-like protein